MGSTAHPGTRPMALRAAGACVLAAAFLSGGAVLARGATAPAPTVERPLPRPGMGWSTYNYFVAKHNHGLFTRMAEAYAASGLRDAGYTILRIDGGWWGDDGNKRHYYWTGSGEYEGGFTYKDGDPHVDPANYPQGLKGLADELHGLGFRLGFYLSPALSAGTSANYPGNRDPQVQPSVKGLALVDRHAAFCAASGVDHLFYDGYDWNREQGTEAYTRMSERIRAETALTGRPMAFSVNTGWKGRHPDWADEWRTGRDINGEWPTVLECLGTLGGPAPAGGGRWNNPDYIMVGWLSDEEAKSQMSLWCVAGAPLYLSHDHRVMSAHDRYVLLNTEAIAVDQDPAARCGSRVRLEGNVQVWARELADGARAAVLLNAGDAPADVGVRWEEIGLGAGAARVRDLWQHRDLGGFAGSFEARAVPAHGCRFVRIAPGAARPPEPPETWAPHPGARPAFTPLSPAGWTFATNCRFDVARLFDGDGKTWDWAYAYPGRHVQIDFGAPTRVDRVVVDHKGTAGPNPWPTTTYAKRTTYEIQVSADGKSFRSVCSGSVGPTYTVADFPATAARCLRFVIVEPEKTSRYSDSTWTAADVYVFDTRARAAPPGDQKPRPGPGAGPSCLLSVPRAKPP